MKKRNKLLLALSVATGSAFAAVTLSTVAWFKYHADFLPYNAKGGIIASYFDSGSGTEEDPYVITRPIHYYHLAYLQQSDMKLDNGDYFYQSELYFQFGKKNLDGQTGTGDDNAYLFYSYDDNGVLTEGEFTPYLNMNYYSGDRALVPLGSSDRPFIGHIAGNNTTIKNIHIDGSGYSDVGIFGYVSEDASISSVYYDSPVIDCKGAVGGRASEGDHAAHNTHVYVGYLAGHVFDPSSFTNVYLNNCKLLNTAVNNYEMITKQGYFGHIDEDMSSTSNSHSYMTQLNAASAYESIDYTYNNNGYDSLALRNSEVSASVHFNEAVTKNGDAYTINERTITPNSGPYSLSTIGSASGNNGVDAYLRYKVTEGGQEYLRTVEDVVQENILNEEPEDNFYGYADGAYLYYDINAGNWKYAQVVGDTSRPSQGTIDLNCFTISYTQTISGTTRTYYLKYKAKTGSQTYDTLVAEESTNNSVPTALEYYFCFRSSFGHLGVSRMTDCTEDAQFYIFSPAGQKYVSTYAPQNVNSSGNCASTSLVHTPVFVAEGGTNNHLPTKFNVSGPTTQLTYKAINNSHTESNRNVNTDFDNNASTTITVGALQGSNFTSSGTWGYFGGHQQSYYCYGGEFQIGQYANQTTTLNNTVDYLLTAQFSDITEGATLLIAGYDGQTGSDSQGSFTTDYGFSTQASDYRVVKKVREVAEGSNYIIQTTTGICGLTIHFTGETYTQYYGKSNNGGGPGGGGGTRTRTQRVFTLYSNGYLYSEASNSDKVLTKDPTFNIADDTDDSCKWVIFPITHGDFTRYRFQNVGHPTRFLCFDSSSTSNRVFACRTNGETNATRAINGSYFNEYSDSSTRGADKWFYIYKQRTGQTLTNIKFAVSTTKNITTTVYPYKNVTVKDLLYAPIAGNSPTDLNAYHNFEKEPSASISWADISISQVHFDEDSVNTWKRVSNVSELRNGDSVVLVASNSTYVMNQTTTNNRFGATRLNITPPFFKNDNLPAAAQIFTLVKCDNGWRFDTGTGFLYASSSDNNYLEQESIPDDNGNADFNISIALTTGDATIIAQGTNTRNRIRYNNGNNNNSRYFTCFGSDSGLAVHIYKFVRAGLDDAVYVGDLMSNFEPYRMDAVGPNLVYNPTYIQTSAASSITKTPTTNSRFYPTSYVKNAYTLLVDYTGSRDLGTLTYDTTSAGSTQPYFMRPSGNTTLGSAGAVDVGENSSHSYIINFNESNIDDLAFCCLKGDGTDESPYTICAANDSNITKYVIVLGCDTTIQTTNISFTFNSENGNVGFSGSVDFRTATYDTNGIFTGSIENGVMVAESNLSIFYDVTKTGQLVSVSVTYEYDAQLEGYVYTVTINSSETNLTEDLIISIYKFDNNASTLRVVLNGVTTTYYTGNTTIVVPKTTSGS